MPGNFSLDLSRFVAKTNNRVDLAVRKVMLEVFRRVVMKSPVQTGRFRGNWNIGYLSPNRGASEFTDPTGAATLSRITAAVQAAPINDGASVFLTNSLPYALELEHGSSKQAPAGMVKVTLAEVTARYGA